MRTHWRTVRPLQIPGTWQGIVNYQIDWVVYDSMVADERVRKQLTAWVGKKIKEYLGDEEPSLAEFIMGKVGEHASPSGMHDMMKEILDNGEGKQAASERVGRQTLPHSLSNDRSLNALARKSQTRRTSC